MWDGIVEAGFSMKWWLSWGFECHESVETGRGRSF